jgi:hypothetical protein
MEKMCMHILTRIKVAPLLQSDNANGCWTRLLEYMDTSGEHCLEQRDARWLMWLKTVCRLLNLCFVWLYLAACCLRLTILRPDHSGRSARHEHMLGIPPQPVRAPLRQKRYFIALPHTKAVPSVKHSDLAYIPVLCCTKQH